MDSLKALPTSLTEEELLKLLEEQNPELSQPVIENTNNDIIPFLSMNNITPGLFKINKRLLYAIYRNWSKAPISSFSFSLGTGIFLQSFRSGGEYFLINQDPLVLAKASYSKIGRIDKTKSPKWKSHFENFLNKYSIKSGSSWLESSILYYLYDKWCYSIKKKQQIGEKQFMNMCKLYFTKTKIDGSDAIWFGLHDSIEQAFEPGQIERLRKVHNEKRKQPKKKTNKKKSKKIS